MTRLLLRLLSATLLLPLLALTPLGAPPAGAQRLGSGSPPMPGFSGYTTSANSELGIGRLPNGRYGVCLDTGPEFAWPTRTPRPRSVVDPMVGFLTSIYVSRARADAVVAAALWWAVGGTLGLNSHPDRVQAHLARLRAEDASTYRRVVRTHDRMLRRAHRLAPGRHGYRLKAPRLIRASQDGGTVARLGVRAASGRWVPGLRLRVTLTGATFGDGARSWSGRTARRPLTLSWRQTSRAPVHVSVEARGLPNHRFLLYDAGPGTQRVAASPGRRSLHAEASLRPAPAAPPHLSRPPRQPALVTHVSLQSAAVGATLSDTVTVSGTGGALLSGEWRLLGPVRPGAGGGCAGASWAGALLAASGRFEADDDGDYVVGSHRVAEPGCYTYVERLDASPTTRAVAWTAPGDALETSLVTSTPTLRTAVNRQRAVAGSVVADTVVLAGLPTGPAATPVTGQWQLLGPVAPDRQQSCRAAVWTAAPVTAQGSFGVTRDGSVSVGATRIGRGGCYTYRERLLGTVVSRGVDWTTPGLVEETALVTPAQPRIPRHPRIDTGRESPGPSARTNPAEVHVPAVGLHASLAGVRFRGATLAPPQTLTGGGLWADGADLEALVGTSVVVGHVSDDHDRPGVFKRLLGVRKGQEVRTRSRGGAVVRWRVTRVRSMPRDQLTPALFAQHVERRLVLVTCTNRVSYLNGGFHYRDNLIVEAVPW